MQTLGASKLTLTPFASAFEKLLTSTSFFAARIGPISAAGLRAHKSSVSNAVAFRLQISSFRAINHFLCWPQVPKLHHRSHAVRHSLRTPFLQDFFRQSRTPSSCNASSNLRGSRQPDDKKLVGTINAYARNLRSSESTISAFGMTGTQKASMAYGHWEKSCAI